jgi:diketogulonate reductase-like aldo/keto reductase
MKYVEVAGVTIPALGFGTWQLRGREAERMVRFALDIGYRHIDTAQMYGNEAEVGQAIRASSVPREEVFVTTKVKRGNAARNDVLRSTDESLSRLDTGYIDLLLLHWPNPSVPVSETLEAMYQLKEAGKVRHIGVSNFTPELMREALNVSPTQLLTNQVEYHPYTDQSELLDIVRNAGMSLTAYSPLAKGRVVKDKSLREIGDAHGKSSVQVALRWLIQQENVLAIPKASSEEHCRENFDIFDFELSAEEMEQIARLGQAEGSQAERGQMAIDWD